MTKQNLNINLYSKNNLIYNAYPGILIGCFFYYILSYNCINVTAICCFDYHTSRLIFIIWYFLINKFNYNTCMVIDGMKEGK